MAVLLRVRRTHHLLIGLTAIFTLLLTFNGLAAASVVDTKVAAARAGAEQAVAELAITATELQAVAPAQWTAADVQRYFEQAIAAVYFAKVAANWSSPTDAAQTDADLSQLVELGYLQAWPANPFNNWEPMRTVALSDGFSAGDLVLQTAPPAYHSKLHGQLYGVSFCLGVYGPSPQFRGAGAPGNGGSNEFFEWAKHPKDAMFVKSLWLQSQAAVQARKQWQKQREQQSVRQ
jgi:hypothetical protein